MHWEVNKRCPGEETEIAHCSTLSIKHVTILGYSLANIQSIKDPVMGTFS